MRNDGQVPEEILKANDIIDWTAFATNLPKLTEISLVGCFALKETMLEQITAANPQIREMEINCVDIDASVLKVLPKYLPNCHYLALLCSSDTNATDVLPEWHQFKSLKSLRLNLDWISTQTILKSVAMAKIPLQMLWVTLRPGTDEDCIFNVVAPLQHLEMVQFFNVGTDVANIDINRLAHKLDNLTMAKFFGGEKITIGWIKAFIRKMVLKPIGVSIGLHIHFECQQTFHFSRNACDDISNALKPHPLMDFIIEIREKYLQIGEFYFLYFLNVD